MDEYKIPKDKRFNIRKTYNMCKFSMLVVEFIEENSLNEFIQKVGCSKKDVDAMLNLNHNYTLTQMLRITEINGYKLEV